MADELSPEELIEEKKVEEFREILRIIKKKVFEKNVYTTQNPAILNEIQDFFASKLYSLLVPVVRGTADISMLQNKEFEALFANILSPPCGEFCRRRMEYYLHRDFVMFPFALDSQSINSQANTNSLENARKFIARN